MLELLVLLVKRSVVLGGILLEFIRMKISGSKLSDKIFVSLKGYIVTLL